MTSTFLLLQNEGLLMQGCFKTSLAALRTMHSAQSGPGYVVFFNYSIGLERLSKVLLLLDHWHRNRQFPSESELKQYGGKGGHDVEMLYKSVTNLFQQYGVEQHDKLEVDATDEKLLNFLSGFAKRSRYFNLNTLTGPATMADPLGEWADLLREVYKQDVPAQDHLPELDELDILVDHIEGNANMNSTAEGCKLVTQSEHVRDQSRLALALPLICWRLVKLLVPLQSLLVVIQERISEDDHRIDGEASVPVMWEFLDFVCEDRNVILKSVEWP